MKKRQSELFPWNVESVAAYCIPVFGSGTSLPSAGRMRLICLRSIEALLLLLLSLNLLLFAEATGRTMCRHRSVCGLHEPGLPFLFQIWKQLNNRGFLTAMAIRDSRPVAPRPKNLSFLTLSVVRGVTAANLPPLH
jgi:hypothetical protein